MDDSRRRLVWHGMFLFLLGWSALSGTYANWAVTTLAAIFGTAALSPISAAGHSGQPWQETVVTAGFMTVGLVIVAASIMVLWGLRRAVTS